MLPLKLLRSPHATRASARIDRTARCRFRGLPCESSPFEDAPPRWSVARRTRSLGFPTQTACIDYVFGSSATASPRWSPQTKPHRKACRRLKVENDCWAGRFDAKSGVPERHFWHGQGPIGRIRIPNQSRAWPSMNHGRWSRRACEADSVALRVYARSAFSTSVKRTADSWTPPRDADGNSTSRSTRRCRSSPAASFARSANPSRSGNVRCVLRRVGGGRFGLQARDADRR